MDVIGEISRCTECGVCMESCPTYRATGEPLFSPMDRLKTAGSIFGGETPDARLTESIYNCPKCMQCDTVCPEGIPVTRIMQLTREELVRRGHGPLEAHNRVIRGILDTGNSVGGDPAKSLEWLPGEFPKRESETLLYMGCLARYLVKDAAASTYKVLEKLGIDFMLLEDEGCCGTYLYESGRRDIAGEYFTKNAEKFSSLGIKNIIVPCNGCLKCFKYFYPEVLGKTEFTVSHALEVIYPKLEENPALLKKIDRKISYQDSCRLSRGEHFTEEPREILKMCGAEVAEPFLNRTEASCCGAGAGIRSVYRDLSMKIASALLESTPADILATACPFCSFNLNYTSNRQELGRKTTYITGFILESLE